MDIQKLLFDGLEWEFVMEIISRTFIMFLIILCVLRISGKRGVRQLSLFEVTIILAMGSASGDPMFQEDIPVFYGFVVLICILIVYKLVTYGASKSLFIHRLLEGKEMIIVKDGVFDLKNEKDNDFSKMEFFTELRNHSIEHLGQVRMAVLEIDGSVSVLYYDKEEVKYGLPLFPLNYKKIDPTKESAPLACMYCGFIEINKLQSPFQCPRCKKKDWTIALNSKRI